MRNGLIAAMGLAALIGCDDSANTFGRSYDECILKNAREGGDQSSRDLAMSICQRRFERDPTNTERDRNVANSGEIAPSPTFMPDAGEDVLRVELNNPFQNVLIVSVKVSVDFYDKPIDENGNRPAESKLLDTLTWDYPTYLAPRENDVMTGSFRSGKAPSEYYAVSARPTKMVPLE